MVNCIMAGPGILKLVCALLAVAVVAAPSAEAASIAPRIPYARSAGGPVPLACCGGIKSMNSAATRLSAGACRLRLPASLAFNYGVVGGIPAKCGVTIPFKLSLSTNCDRSVEKLGIHNYCLQNQWPAP